MEIIKIPKKEGIIDRTTGKVLNRKLRVAAYARVSTMGAEQLNSYESQKKYYEMKSIKEMYYRGKLTQQILYHIKDIRI